MPFFGRQKIAEAAKEIADHLQLVKNVKALQIAQKELTDANRALGDRIRAIETELRALKAEAVLESVRQTQSIVNAVQGGLNDRIQDLAVQVALAQRQPGQPLIEIGRAQVLPPGDSQQLPAPAIPPKAT